MQFPLPQPSVTPRNWGLRLFSGPRAIKPPPPPRTFITVSSVGSSCRPPSHHRSRTGGRLDFVRQQRVTFLFSGCDTDPRMVTELGGTEGEMGFQLGSLTQADGGGGPMVRSVIRGAWHEGPEGVGGQRAGLTGDLQRDAPFLGP